MTVVMVVMNHPPVLKLNVTTPHISNVRMETVSYPVYCVMVLMIVMIILMKILIMQNVNHCVTCALIQAISFAAMVSASTSLSLVIMPMTVEMEVMNSLVS
uniref:Uncharacterized protein n=1 Tax=Cacopsylla melanoneura TaxID=428564 RepID=A0A8D9ALK8_9HEMI